jgi:tetratricopeptide (TPR) repeat protein
MALARLPGDHPDRARVLATLCSELAYGSTLERRQALADEALAIAESSGDDAIIVWVQNHIFDPLFVPSLLEQRRTQSADAVARAERIGDPFMLYMAATYAMAAAGAAGDIDDADRCLEIMRSVADQLNQPMVDWLVTFMRAGRALLAGDTDQAEQLATAALELGTDSGQPDATLTYEGQFIGVSWQRGTVGDLVPLIEQAVADNPGLPSLTAMLATAYTEAGRTDDARRLLQQFSAADFDLPLDFLWTAGMVQYAEAAIDCQDQQRAGPLFDRLAPYADQWSYLGTASFGPVSHYLGGLATVLRRYDEADAYFTQAAAISLRMGAKFDAARTNLSWGNMLAERDAPGDIEKARELLTQAHTAAAANGYANVERRAAQALQPLD